MALLGDDWENSGLDGVRSDLLADRGQEALAHLQRLGVRVIGPNRVSRAVDLVRHSDPDKPPPGIEPAQYLRIIGEAMRTLWDTFLITWTIVEWCGGDVSLFPPEKLQWLLKGSDLPDERNTTARDIQFENLVGAMLVLGGAAVSREEPDWRIRDGGTIIGIPAKRVSSASRTTVRNRLRHAARRLKEHDLNGLVALNADVFLTNFDAPSPAGTALPAPLMTALEKQLEGAFAAIGDQAHKRHLLGVQVVGTVIQWQREGGKLHPRWTNPDVVVVLSTPEDSHSGAATMRLVRALRDGQGLAIAKAGELLTRGRYRYPY